MHDVKQNGITTTLSDLPAHPKRQRAVSGTLTRKQQMAQAQQRRRAKLKEAGYVQFNHLIPGKVGEKFEKVKKLSQLGTHEEVLDLLVTAALEGRLPLSLNVGD